VTPNENEASGCCRGPRSITDADLSALHTILRLRETQTLLAGERWPLGPTIGAEGPLLP
jgi:hypothetical protein